MPRIAYVNGRYVPHDRAMVHIEDRGFQFADSVYEVIAVIDGHMADTRGHMDRLWRSMGELGINAPAQRPVMELVIDEMIRRNRICYGLVYIQVTRGVAPRDFKFPADVKSTLVMTARPMSPAAFDKRAHGATVITVPDIRWKRRDIKSTALLPQVMAKQKAAEAGAYEAWMVDDDGFVTEGSSSNAWIVNKDGVLVTRPVTNEILKGVTRTAIMHLCAEEGISVEERPFSVDEAYDAREAFVTSAGGLLTPVVKIDDHVIGNGSPGLLADRLLSAYEDYTFGNRGPERQWEYG